MKYVNNLTKNLAIDINAKSKQHLWDRRTDTRLNVKQANLFWAHFLVLFWFVTHHFPLHLQQSPLPIFLQYVLEFRQICKFCVNIFYDSRYSILLISEDATPLAIFDTHPQVHTSMISSELHVLSSGTTFSRENQLIAKWSKCHAKAIA